MLKHSSVRYVLLFVVLAVVLSAFAGTALAQGQGQGGNNAGGGNVDCASGLIEALKIDLNSGMFGTTTTYTVASGSPIPLTITVTISADGKYLSWSSNFGMSQVIVKGGSNPANVYNYNGYALSDSNLNSPDNSGGNLPEISNYKFCYTPMPDLTIVKIADPVEVCIGLNETVTYTYVVTNTGNVPLRVTVTDDKLGTITNPTVDIGVGGSATLTKDAVINETTTNIATASAEFFAASATAQATVTAVECVTPPPAQWCSPGYWRQPQHFGSWAATGISRDATFFATFGFNPTRSQQGVRSNAPTNPTLIYVLSNPNFYGGDDFNRIGDLLSAAHPGVTFTGVRVENSCPLGLNPG